MSIEKKITGFLVIDSPYSNVKYTGEQRYVDDKGSVICLQYTAINNKDVPVYVSVDLPNENTSDYAVWERESKEQPWRCVYNISEKELEEV